MTSTPRVARTRAELADLLAPARTSGSRIALVPTMGALHAGHASLCAVAREAVGPDAPVVVSIFVNPMQFGPGEDLDRYPRTFDDDLALCGEQGVDVVFAPEVAEVYPGGEPLVSVDPGPVADQLEGESRPGHFRGVLTVVAKLFGLVGPDVAVFGQKDYQQLVLVRRMVSDLCLGVEIVGAETRREPDGLALSSRNVYLDAEERQIATVLSRALRAAQGRAAYGVPPARWAAMSVLQSEPGFDADYLALRTADLAELPDYPERPVEGRILVAGRVGKTRLIDNLPIDFGPATEETR